MSKGTLCLGFLTGSLLAASCSTPGSGEFARDFELYVEDGELDTVTVEDDFGTSLDLGAERARVGGRFAFGGESVRGFFQVFGENWEFVGLPGNLPGAEYDCFGIGGGVMGAPKVNGAGDAVALIIPYRADMSVVGGDKSNTVPFEPDTDMLYVDMHLEIGFGIDWKGLRPSAGVAVNALGGTLSNTAGDLDLTGSNAGFFVDLRYKHPDFPLYGHIRALMGDYQATTIGIGAKF